MPRPTPAATLRAIARSVSPVATRTVSAAIVAPLRFSGSPGSAQRHDLDLGPRQQARDLAAERRVAPDDRALHPAAELVVAEQRPVAAHGVPSEARAADDLGDERPAALEREGLGIRPGIGARDDDGAGSALEHVRLVLRLGAADRPRRCRRRPGRARPRRPRASSAGHPPAPGRGVAAARTTRAARRRAARGTGDSGARDRPPASRRRAPPRTPRPRARGASSVDPASPASSTSSGTGRSASHRTLGANMPGWRVVWLAPTPRSSGGRSAVRISSGTPAWWDSRAAGRRFAAAVPEVQTTATGSRVSRASPRAVKPATRSSMRTCRRMSPRASRRAATSASAWDREPGLRTMCRRPSETSSPSRAAAASVAGDETRRAGTVTL